MPAAATPRGRARAVLRKLERVGLTRRQRLSIGRDWWKMRAPAGARSLSARGAVKSADPFQRGHEPLTEAA